LIAGQRQNNPIRDILRLSEHFIALRLKLGTGQDLEERENPAVQTFCRLMWKCWNGLGNTEKGKQSVVSKVINSVIDYCRIWCALEGVVATSHLSKPQDKHSRARASSAKPAQAREGRSALLCQLLACRAGIPLSPETIPVPILSSIAVSTNKALCTFHLEFPTRSDLQESATYGCPNKRHLPTFYFTWCSDLQPFKYLQEQLDVW